MLSNNMSKILGANRAEFRALSGNLLSAAQGELPKTVLVASSRPGEGRTTTAIAMAHTLATESNARVLLVDADTENPSLHTCFELEQGSGLSESLNGEMDSIMKSGVDRLDVLRAGDAPDQTARALSSGGVVKLLQQWSEHYDHVILDSSPVLTTSVPTSLAPHVDGILLVAECERTKWQVLETAQGQLLGAGGNILGVILNKRRYYIPRFLYGSV
jgi:protein-tyrosine kinase